MRSRAGFSVSIGALIMIVLGLLFIWFVGIPLMNSAFRGVQSAFVCDGECAFSQPADYYHDMKGDAYCNDNQHGTKCYLPLKEGKGSFVRAGDIKLYYNNDKKHPLRDGAVVQLRPTMNGNDVLFAGRFSLGFTKEAKFQKCYWQASIDGDEAITYFELPAKKPPFQELFKKAYKSYTDNTHSSSDTPRVSQLKLCSEYAGDAALSLKPQNAFALLGKQIEFTLIVVNKKSCDKIPAATVDSCDTYTRSVRVEVPDRNPVLTLFNGKTPASRTQQNQLVVGESQQFTAQFKEQYAYCSIKIKPEISGFSPVDLGSAPYQALAAIQTGEAHDGSPEPCFKLKPWERRIDLNLPETVARGIPFRIVLNTSFEDDEKNIVAKDGAGNPIKPGVVVSYPFRIAPDPRLTVTGPSPGLTKEKNIDIACNGVECRSFQVAYLSNPLDCHKGVYKKAASFKSPTAIKKYGASTEARWRFTLKNESENGKYVCVKAATNKGDLYALGLSNGVPTRVSIDATPPELALSFTIGDSFVSVLKMRCNDPTGPSGDDYTGGCKERPYSYAYITDPASFASKILTGATGGLLNDWHGCPDPDTGYWITYNSDKEEMEYLDNAVKVICIRAQDNAGNSVVKSKLLYNGQEMLALFLREMAKKGII